MRVCYLDIENNLFQVIERKSQKSKHCISKQRKDTACHGRRAYLSYCYFNRDNMLCV